MTTYVDPFAAASDAQLAPKDIFGQVQVDAWFCVLTKGVGREPFDESLHKPEERRTAIDMFIIPLAEMGMQFDVQRRMVAESKEWAGIVLPSMKKLGVNNLRDLNGRWVRLRFVPTGRTYANANGETKEATTYQFLAVYDNEDACRTAWEATGNGATDDAPGEATPSVKQTPTPTPTPTPTNNNQTVTKPESAMAYEFLKVLVAQANGDQAKLAELIAGVPLVAKYYKETSIEAVELLDKERQLA